MLMVVSAVISWLIGRWSLRRSFDREAYQDTIIANQHFIVCQLQERLDEATKDNKELRAALRGITSLATGATVTTTQQETA